MYIKLNNFLVFILFLILIGCASQDGKVLVEGADSEISTRIEDNETRTSTENEAIVIEDNLSEYLYQNN